MVYKEKEFLDAIYNAINNDEAILEDAEGKTAGLLMCSKNEKELTFLAVHSDYSKKGEARRLIQNMSEWFTAGDIISVNTFQDSEPKGIPTRACYHACGAVCGEYNESRHQYRSKDNYCEGGIGHEHETEYQD